MISTPSEICVVGAGPRGVSVLERLLAQERKSPSRERLTVHIVDPSPPGPGRVWRTAQSPHLLMNTVASQVTLFTDHSVDITGPVEDGPSLYEWARRLAGTGAPPGGPDEPLAAEARALGPDSYPTRAFYGHYLRWVFRRLLATAPAHITVRVHTSRAVALDDAGPTPDGPQSVLLADGTKLTGLDAVVLALGHLPARPTPETRMLADFAATHGLTYLQPANPADHDLSGIAAGQPVLLRGLGLNFFDHVTLFTLGRGGSFTRVGDRLVYAPSGEEPRMFAGSRRGVPYHARGENQKGAHGRHEPRLLDQERVAALRERARRGERLSFRTDLWPLIAREVQGVFYTALLTSRGQDATAFADTYPHIPDGQEEAFLDAAGIGAADRWDWDRIARPYGDREFTDVAAYRAWLLGHLRQDVTDARAGNVTGPLKAALDVLRDLRNEIRLVVDHDGIEGTSYRDELHGWYTPLNAFLSIGPPASRIEELAALIEAGVVEILPPGLRVGTVADGPAFTARTLGGADVAPPFTALIEARLPEPDLLRTADPLLRHLLSTGQCRPHRIPDAHGGAYETGGLDVTTRPYRLVDATGRTHPRRFAYGVPTESVHWVTAAGIRPGVGSVTLEDSDAIAHAVLSLPTTVSDLRAATGPAEVTA
ncbi:FAD/NAD(P)-binding protein [Streptomyces sp. NBC_01601]|uniref:FAD/NAD(P)-binding protein n=1 Tax=Streptomyces sp. NBC_01601 TaxID=2975892 RepID=UPI002E294D6A|nr:FAD/NAD(P)-binding protein [Streptomyces sp. NBC_01601]